MNTNLFIGKLTNIKQSKTINYPDGDAEIMWKGLKRKYKPMTAFSLAKLHKQFYSTKLKKKLDPDIFITYLEDLRNCMEEMNLVMPNEQFMLHVLNNITKGYENQMNKVNDTLEIEELRDKLRLCFEPLNSKYKSDDHNNEKALFGTSHFKGHCCTCGIATRELTAV
jgi:hypothetical protein